MTADHQAGAAIAMMPHGHLLRCCLAMHVDNDSIGDTAERHGIQRGVDGTEWIFQ